jgi:hypothetical protein
LNSKNTGHFQDFKTAKVADRVLIPRKRRKTTKHTPS